MKWWKEALGHGGRLVGCPDRPTKVTSTTRVMAQVGQNRLNPTSFERDSVTGFNMMAAPVPAKVEVVKQQPGKIS